MRLAIAEKALSSFERLVDVPGPLPALGVSALADHAALRAAPVWWRRSWRKIQSVPQGSYCTNPAGSSLFVESGRILFEGLVRFAVSLVLPECAKAPGDFGR